MNLTSKRWKTDAKIRHWLEEHGYKNIHLFPHLRFIKDVSIDDLKFDGIATKLDEIVLFQNKTNRKPSKQQVLDYRNFGVQYGVRCLYIVYINRKGIEVYE